MRAGTAAVFVGACAVGAPLAWWAMGAPVRTEPDSALIGPDFESVASGIEPVEAFDAEVFSVKLWNPVAPPAPVTVAAPPPPPPPPPPSPPPAGPMPALLAIVRAQPGQPLRAAMYDPAQDRVVLVGEGDAIAGRTVVAIGDAMVELRGGGQVVRLDLQPRAGGP